VCSKEDTQSDMIQAQVEAYNRVLAINRITVLGRTNGKLITKTPHFTVQFVIVKGMNCEPSIWPDGLFSEYVDEITTLPEFRNGDVPVFMHNDFGTSGGIVWWHPTFEGLLGLKNHVTLDQKKLNKRYRDNVHKNNRKLFYSATRTLAHEILAHYYLMHNTLGGLRSQHDFQNHLHGSYNDMSLLTGARTSGPYLLPEEIDFFKYMFSNLRTETVCKDKKLFEDLITTYKPRRTPTIDAYTLKRKKVTGNTGIDFPDSPLITPLQKCGIAKGNRAFTSCVITDECEEGECNPYLGCHCKVPKCGDGVRDAGEDCGEPGLSCMGNDVCVDCKCKRVKTPPPVTQTNTRSVPTK